jgi:hypothetical protein
LQQPTRPLVVTARITGGPPKCGFQRGYGQRRTSAPAPEELEGRSDRPETTAGHTSGHFGPQLMVGVGRNPPRRREGSPSYIRHHDLPSMRLRLCPAFGGPGLRSTPRIHQRSRAWVLSDVAPVAGVMAVVAAMARTATTRAADDGLRARAWRRRSGPVPVAVTSGPIGPSNHVRSPSTPTAGGTNVNGPPDGRANNGTSRPAAPGYRQAAQRSFSRESRRDSWVEAEKLRGGGLALQRVNTAVG